MTSSNAGLRRNRLPAGVVGWNPKMTFSPEMKDTLVGAARASGNLSLSLYLELLLRQIEDEAGQLPILSPELELNMEVPKTAAA